MNLIAAVDLKWNIGNEGKLLCYIPEDLKFFKKTTLGKTVIMGRKTLESLPGGRPLPGRLNVVLSRNPDYKVDGVVVLHSIDELLGWCVGKAREDLFVIGGAEIYGLLFPYCHVAYITRIAHEFEADSSLVAFDGLSDWVKVAESEVVESVKGWKFSFLQFARG